MPTRPSDEGVRLIGCEAAGRGVDTAETAATTATGTLGIFHGMRSHFCQDDYGQIAPVYRISAGLDHPGIGPEHAALRDSGRADKDVAAIARYRGEDLHERVQKSRQTT